MFEMMRRVLLMVPALTVALALLALALPARADQVLENALLVSPEGRSTALRPLHYERQGIFGGPMGGHQPHDREVPYFPGDVQQRIWNGPPQWGAGLPVRPWQRPAPPETTSGELPRSGGDLRRRIQQAIRRNRLQRYNRRLEGLRLLEQYRAEKSMLGLCPVDDCLEPRFVLEARPFSDEGYCREHSEKLIGSKRVEWAVGAAEDRLRQREAERKARLRDRDEGGRFKGDPREVVSASVAMQDRTNAARALFGHAPLPEDFPRAADLGPNGTLPAFADPRDPAGYPYDSIDTDPHPYSRPVEKETKSWVTRSLEAP